MIDNLQIIKALCRYMSAVNNGQKLDLLYVGKKPAKAQILEMYDMKTCALIQAACVAGVMAADGSEAAIKNAHDYAYNLGMAFQLIDDILDEEGYENAKEDAEKYTREALELLENVPNNEFLKALTETLLNRKN
jgi:geranylgeranyl diphosphate synthase type II